MPKKNPFGPKNVEEQVIYAEENLRVDVQCALCKAMKRSKVSKTELAKRLGVSSPNSVNRLFNPEMNITLKKLAKVFNALGAEIKFFAILKK